MIEPVAEQRIAVRFELVREFLLERIDRIAAEGTELPAEVAAAAELLGGDAAAARHGYHARVAETELFAAARTSAPGLAARLQRSTAAELAAELAAAEPDERPDPGAEGAFSWEVPGPGGHVRHYLAVASGDKRAWLAGFYVRCCEELLPQ